MSFIIGNKTLLSEFENLKKSGRISHSYIIEGAKGSGRLTLARALSAMILCGSTPFCEKCDTCNKVLQGIHQDVRELIPELDPGVIKIDDIREVIKETHIKPAESDKKIFIIENAQQMNIPAQNALLQTFEEAPKNVIFFLLVTNRNLLLPTIKSRAVTLKSERLPEEVIKKELERRYPKKTDIIDEAVLLSDGALGAGILVMENGEMGKAVSVVKSYFTALDTDPTFLNLSEILGKKVSEDRKFMFWVLTYFSSALRDVLVLPVSPDTKPMFFTDRQMCDRLSKVLKKEQIFEVYNTITTVLQNFAKINTVSALANINMAMSSDFSK
ncbi:MAG: hypothetical protein E7582_00180 [Ruminococcaceae bacterium]|nr:hypothetical protein [Oscillospiraceae bacterium]